MSPLNWMAPKDVLYSFPDVLHIIDNAILFSITQGYMNTGTAKC